MTLSLARVLYRSLLRTSRKLDAQIQRHASVDVFTAVSYTHLTLPTILLV